VEPLLEIRGLTKHYGAIQALRGIDLSIREGTVYGFIGPNGAGKTTTIRILAGLVAPTAGSARLAGLDLQADRVRAAAGLRALVEVPAFYPVLTGRENLSVFGRLARAARGEVDELLEAVGLAQAADRAVGGYSLGMRQRLGIAQALIGRPRLVVLDEPMNGLDPAAIHLVRRLVHERQREHGVTFFISSHLLHDVETLCDEVGIIHRGAMVAEGRIEDLLSGSVSGFRLQTADDAAACAALAAALPDCGARRDAEGHVVVDGDESILPGLTRALLDAGLAARDVTPIRDTLERYFIEKTEGVMG
jgi:ABC-type multidrug transport system ATPase subunit